MLLSVHIAAGGLAIVLGAVALSVKKGGTIHRRSGLSPMASTCLRTDPALTAHGNGV